MAVVGAVIGAVGSLAQGAAAATEARYQAQVAQMNAKIAEQNAEYQIIKGSREEEAFRIKSSNLIGAQKAAASVSGIDVNQGSPLRTLMASKVLEALDAATIRNNAAREAHDFETQAVNFQAQSKLYGMQASNAMLAGGIGAASSLAGAVGSVSPRWDSWRSGTAYSPVDYGPSLSTPPMTVPVSYTPFTPAPRVAAPYMYGSS